jgi:hypothetical protein
MQCILMDSWTRIWHWVNRGIIGVQPGIHNDKRRMDSWTPMMWERAPISLTLIGFLLSLELPVLLRFTRLRLYEWILEVPGSLEDLVKMNCCLQASDSYHRSVEHMILMTDLWFITWELIHNHLKVPRLWMKNSHVDAASDSFSLCLIAIAHK